MNTPCHDDLMQRAEQAIATAKRLEQQGSIPKASRMSMLSIILTGIGFLISLAVILIVFVAIFL